MRGLVPGLTERGRRVAVRLIGVTVATGGLALMGFGTIGSPLASGGTAAAAPGGHNNKEDVFLDNVGQPCCPGHEQDPHLTCTDINIWGVSMTDPSGTYTIDGWPPSGSHEQDYPASGDGAWTYDQTLGGPQVISVINVHTLISNAIANGDTPQGNQSFHFKLQLLQAPQKHKTFWVDCPTTSTTSTSSTTSTTSSSTHRTTHTTSTAASSTTSSTAASSTSSLVPPVSTSSSVGTGTLAVSTATPSTGADAEFGLGLGLMIAGGGLVAAAARMGRQPKS
ncbi:MAG TPA: hypothetical protein VF155_07115 [Candidatus Dormibacteraeota bacterium]